MTTKLLLHKLSNQFFLILKTDTMSLLNQFGLKPLQSVKGHRTLTHDLVVTVLKQSAERTTPYYSIALRGLLNREKLNWEGVDVAFSKQHGGLVIAKGTTFKIDSLGRFSSRSVVDAIWKGFGLKEQNEARACLSASKYSQDVYVCKIESFEVLNNNGQSASHEKV